MRDRIIGFGEVDVDGQGGLLFIFLFGNVVEAGLEREGTTVIKTRKRHVKE